MTTPPPNPDGGSVLDLPELPSAQMRLIRVLLRHGEISYQELCQRLAELPDAERLTVAEIDAALMELTQQNWVKRQTDNLQNVDMFRANVRRQNPREALVTVQRQKRQLPGNIWDALDKK